MELVVFDLDGTLLNANAEVSDFTRETLRLLAKKNIAYTVATGRSLYSAKDILSGSVFSLPQVYINGVVTWHPNSNQILLNNPLTLSEIKHIIEAALSQHVTPFITCLLYTSPSPRDQRGSRMPSSA